MPKCVVILDNGGGPLSQETVDFEEGDDTSENASQAIHRAIEGWVLSIGDTIKIREPGREDQ